MIIFYHPAYPKGECANYIIRERRKKKQKRRAVYGHTSVGLVETLHFVPYFGVIYHCVIPESESNRSNLTASLSGAVSYRESAAKSKSNRMHLDYLALDREARERAHPDD